MKTDDIRRKFLEFFHSKDHKVVPSDSLLPSEDPTLLFTGAGMNQFKNEFYGRGRPGLKRAATCQKCLRTGDIENVGRTAGHHTFFEMLGNFSFGDYFKSESIRWAWEFMLDVLEVPADRLVVSIYEDDEQAFQIWREEIGVAENVIYRYGESENFWPANARTQGPNGPCGPCTEIHYDYGPSRGCGRPDCGPSCDCDRFCEVWNLVFQQFDRQEDGSLKPLPMQNIDTGMGLERIARVIQGVPTNFDIDIFQPLTAHIGEIAGVEYSPDSDQAQYVRRIADHVRAVTFCIADGAVPSNEKQGYVVRRLLRRAVRDGVQLGIEGAFMASLVEDVVNLYGETYPELVQARKHVENVVAREEETFDRTVRRGSNKLDSLIADLKRSRETVLRGADAFDLYQTYGFPVEMTQSILAEQDLSVDMQGFLEAMQRHIDGSRGGSRFEDAVFAQGPLAELKDKHASTEFTGYQTLASMAHVIGIIVGDELVDRIDTGQEAVIVLDRTPAYAEAGGQVGDVGVIRSPNGQEPTFKFSFFDTKRESEFHLHEGTCEEGSLSVGDEVMVLVDEQRRRAIMRNHTATHLLHHALKHVLGEHANQAGSYVGPERLRFDFTHATSVEVDQLEQIERIVNQRILENEPVAATKMSLDEARKAGAMALFGEKYGDIVRVLTVGDFSRELCGGTHCHATGDIGSFHITSESSIAGGVRRIEAVTGWGVLERLQEKEELLQQLSEALNAQESALPRRLKEILEQQRSLEKRLKKERESAARKMAQKSLADQTEQIGDVDVVIARLETDMNGLRSAADVLRKGSEKTACLLIAASGGKVQLVCAFSPDLVKERDVHAGDVIKKVAAVVGGGGGGRPDMAQAGGSKEDKIDEALATARRIFGEVLG